MKKYCVLVYLCFALLFAGCEAEYVATVPSDVVVVRSEPPYVGAIWIDAEWQWSGGRYVSVPGHWEHPRGTWQRGNWQKQKKGYRWHRGSWH